MRLACQVRVLGDLRVVVPEETRLADQKILTEGVERPVPLAPNVHKAAVHLPPPSIDDQRADAERLLDGLAEKGFGGLEIDVRAARELPERLRALDFHPAVVIIGRDVVHLDRPTTNEACYGIAFDVGTTPNCEPFCRYGCRWRRVWHPGFPCRVRRQYRQAAMEVQYHPWAGRGRS